MGAVTAGEFVKVVKSVDLTRMPFRVDVEASVKPDGDSVSLMVAMRVKDREHGHPLTVYVVDDVPYWVLENMDLSRAERKIRDHLQRALLHELDECLFISGERIFDPHATDGMAVAGRRRGRG